MFASLRRLIGLISVRETGDLITISGLPGDTVQQSIYDIWESHKIAANVFTHIGNSEVTFNRFFAVDVAYIFERIVDENRKGHNIRALKRTLEEMYQNTWLKNTLIKHPDIVDMSKLSALNVTMMPHQLNFFRLYNDVKSRYLLKGYILGADPGTGKTLMGIGLSLILHADLVICVVPKNAVKRVWEDTLIKFFKQPQKFWTSLDDEEPKRDTKYLIVHFAALQKLLDHLRHLGVHGKVVILLDESHNLNEEDSLQSQQFEELCHYTRADDIIWSSGTPIKAVGREAAPIFSTIDPFFDEDARNRFKAIYGKNAQRANDILNHRMGKVHFHVSKRDVVNNETHFHTIQVTIPNAVEYTLDAIKEKMVKFVKDRVAYYEKNMKNFEKTYEDILKYFESTLPKKSLVAHLSQQITGKPTDDWEEYNKYRSYIRQIRKGFDPRKMRDISAFCNHYEKHVIMPVLPKELRDQFKDLRSIIKYYMLKVQGEALGQVLGQQRVKCHEDMMRGEWFEEMTVKGKKELVPRPIDKIIDSAIKKTIIFTTYVPVVDAAAKYLKQIGYKPILVYGATNNDLAAHVGTFERDININPLIATFKSLSTAVPLVMANNTIFTNVPFRDYEYQQALARTDRNGQDSPCHFWNVKLDTGDTPNISTRSHDIMAWSKQQVEEILGQGHLGPATALESYKDGDAWMGSFMTLEDFAEMEDYESEFSGRQEEDAPIKPSWSFW
jgi:hypothetical protein